MRATDLQRGFDAQTLNLFLGADAAGARGDKPLLADVPEVEFANCALLGEVTRYTRGVPYLSADFSAARISRIDSPVDLFTENYMGCRPPSSHSDARLTLER